MLLYIRVVVYITRTPQERYQRKIEHNLHVEKLLIALSHDPIIQEDLIFVGIFLNYYQYSTRKKIKMKRKTYESRLENTLNY